MRGYFLEEKSGVIPSTKWKLKNLGKGWVLGETLLTGIGQGYIQCTPLELCLMAAQIANGGFKIRPRIIDDGTAVYEDIKSNVDNQLQKFKLGLKEKKVINVNEEFMQFLPFPEDLTKIKSVYLKPLFRNPENVKFVNEAMYAVSNEFMGTAYASRHEKKKYQYAGKTGTSQVKRITEEQRELELDTKDIPYEDRDHAVFIGFAPYKDPRYAISVLIEHGGSGGKVAAPLAKKVIKVVIDRHKLREKVRKERENRYLKMITSNTFSEKKTFLEKIKSIDYILVVVILLIGIISSFAMYSTDGGQFKYHTNSHILKFSLFFILFIILSFIRIGFWHSLAYIFYAVILGMLIYVLWFGVTAQGSQRWINLYFINLQPSELMKIAIIVCFAKFYHRIQSQDINKIQNIVYPIILLALPIYLVIAQPDLGTSILIAASGLAVIWLAGR